MKRLYFLTRDIDAVDAISDRLHEKGISDWNFHVLGKNKSELHKHHLHSTNPLHELDIIRGGERGVIIGLGSGIIVLGILALGLGVNITWFMALGILVLLTMFGTWLGGLVGLSTENYKIRKFHDLIEEGHFLIMVDVAKEQAREFSEVVEQYPHIRAAGTDSTIITPFKNLITH